ncbi:superoxide dismutase [Pradoshia sp. D12]|uniref:superoxide dismutase n=1 Tax=Bacillaceae TaxID=186817 RepID=UPI00112EDEEC|nr:MULTISPECIES: superoxide dismutase [Bacillaceae]QFK71857.1 superoxide dismutase [Pradoshia sp. D12]TPF73652.1 superoxide dismutase [Bacillus sp. D12]
MNPFKKYWEEVDKWKTAVVDWAADQEESFRSMIMGRVDHLTAYLNSMKNKTPSQNELIELQNMMKELDESVQKAHNGDSYVPPGRHALPPLPYSYDALEPFIDREIMRLHHTIHHQTYVDGLNKAETKMKEARDKDDYDLLKHWEREAAFHGSGHYLHTIFWYNMKPDGGGEPTGELMNFIKRDFGSFTKFKKEFTEAAKKVEGVGWAILVWSNRAHRLEILQSERHMILTQWDTIPLLVLDVWEHAYYLQYKTDRPAYINNWWNLVNWNNVSERFEQARKIGWKIYKK